MKTMRWYGCDCGESIEEDDDACINCGKPADKSKLARHEIAEITSQTWACSGTSEHLATCDGFCR